MRTILSIVLIIGLGYLAHLYLPWWWLIALVSLLVSLAFGESSLKSFFVGFFSIFCLWLFLTLANSVSNNFLLVDKMSNLFNLPHSSLLILVTALIGGLIGGFSSMTGYFLKTFND